LFPSFPILQNRANARSEAANSEPSSVGPLPTLWGEGRRKYDHIDAKAGGLKVPDYHLAGRSYVACARLTIADFQLSSMATYWRESEMPMEAFPNIVRWIDGLMCIPAWAEPWP
jgi:glutathione S-transferase